MSLYSNFLRNFTFKDKKRIAKNFSSNLLSNFSRIIIQIFFPILMISVYGLEKFGIWLFIIAIPDVFYLLNLDFNSAAKTQLSIYYNQKKYTHINKLFVNFSLLNFSLILFLLPVCFYAINNIDLNLKIFESIEINQLKKITLIVVFAFFLNFIIAILETGISFKGKNYISENINTIFDFISKLLIIIFGLISNSLLFAAYAYAISNLIRVLIFYFWMKKLSSELKLIDINKIKLSQIIYLFNLSIPYYLKSISNLFKHSYQLILLGVFFGPYIVGLISTFKTMFYFFPIRIWSIAQRTIMYEFTRLYAQRKIKLLKENFKIFIKICFLFLTIFIFITFLYGELIYTLWLNEKFTFNYLIVFLIVFDLCFHVLANSFNHIFKSINNFLNFSKLEAFLNISIFLIALQMFKLDYDYYLLFLFNLIVSILLAVYSLKILFKKFNFRLTAR
jgi:O-antigen/teichoic acid export membrane protein